MTDDCKNQRMKILESFKWKGAKLKKARVHRKDVNGDREGQISVGFTRESGCRTRGREIDREQKRK